MVLQVNIVLENQRVEYRPTMINLTHVVNIVAKELISIVAVIPRLKDVMLNAEPQQSAAAANAQEGPSASAGEAAPLLGLAAEVVAAQERQAAADKMNAATSFYHIISNDHDTLNIVVQIMNGMSSAATEMQKYQSFWDKYKPLWEMDIDVIIRNRKYAKSKRSLQQYEAEIVRYKEQQNEIEKEDATYAVMFIKIDCTLIKKALVDHCVQWQNKLTGLLNQNALADLRALHDMFQHNTRKLLVHPSGLDHLSENIGCLKELVKELPKIEEQFEPLEEMYGALKKFEVQIPEAEMHMVNNLRTAFEEFKDMLSGSEKMLEKSKQNMKRDLESSLESFNGMVRSTTGSLVACSQSGAVGRQLTGGCAGDGAGGGAAAGLGRAPALRLRHEPRQGLRDHPRVQGAWCSVVLFSHGLLRTAPDDGWLVGALDHCRPARLRCASSRRR